MAKIAICMNSNLCIFLRFYHRRSVFIGVQLFLFQRLLNSHIHRMFACRLVFGVHRQQNGNPNNLKNIKKFENTQRESEKGQQQQTRFITLMGFCCFLHYNAANERFNCNNNGSKKQQTSSSIRICIMYIM